MWKMYALDAWADGEGWTLNSWLLMCQFEYATSKVHPPLEAFKAIAEADLSKSFEEDELEVWEAGEGLYRIEDAETGEPYFSLVWEA